MDFQLFFLYVYWSLIPSQSYPACCNWQWFRIIPPGVSGDRWHLGTLGSHSAHLWFVSTNYAYPQVIKHAWPVIFPVTFSRLEWISRRHVWLSDGTSNYLLKWGYRQSFGSKHLWTSMEYPWVSVHIHCYYRISMKYQWNIRDVSTKYWWNDHENIHWYPMNIIPA